MRRSVMAAALALAGAMCCGLAGCGAGGSGDKDVYQQAQDYKGHEVTEEQWAAAFALFENPFVAEGTEYTVSASYKQDCYDTETGEFLGLGLVVEDKFILKGNKAWTWEKYSYPLSVDEGYNSEPLEDNVYYKCVKEGGGQVIYEYDCYEPGNTWTERDDFIFMGTGCSMALNLSDGLMSEVYSDFKYDADKKGYVGSRLYQLAEGETGGEKVVKFDEKGRLIAIYSDLPGGWLVEHAAVVITYAAQDFDLPAVE